MTSYKSFFIKHILFRRDILVLGLYVVMGYDSDRNRTFWIFGEVNVITEMLEVSID